VRPRGGVRALLPRLEDSQRSREALVSAERAFFLDQQLGVSEPFCSHRRQRLERHRAVGGAEAEPRLAVAAAGAGVEQPVGPRPALRLLGGAVACAVPAVVATARRAVHALP
jgi:hypothetical protein